MADSMIDVEVAYATVEKQLIIVLQVPQGSTAAQAIALSKMSAHFPESDLSTCKIGIFSQICKSDTVLKSHDRVEIYRPLIHNPMQARRNRAAKGV